MKIAIVDHIGNYGGSSRVLRRLIPSLLKCDKEIVIHLFGNPKSLKREKFQEFKSQRIRIIDIFCA